MENADLTTRNMCIYRKWCGNPGCRRQHPAGWDPHVVKFDRSNEYCVYALNSDTCTIPNCKRKHDANCPKGVACCVQCSLLHPVGHKPTQVQCVDNCANPLCLGVHSENRTDEFCQYDPFCTRIEGGSCPYNHSPDNGKLRMVRGYCNYKANGLICQHRTPCPYTDPHSHPCTNGRECRWRGCGFSHNGAKAPEYQDKRRDRKR